MIDRPTDLLVTGGQAAKKIKLILRAVVNIVKRSRTGAAVLAGIRTTARSFGRVLHQLWL